MCVIFVSTKDKRVPDEWVRAGYEHNSAGAGIAYRGEKGVVVWKKGMDLGEVRELAKKVPLPYALHFRIPTCGGSIKKLTHPFPIEVGVPLTLEGRIRGHVLFHNGHWGRWKDYMLESAARGRIKIPNDKWSDSRAMAWMAAHFGLGVLDLIDEKICAFGPEHIEIYGTGWVIKEGIYCSNTHWEFTAKKFDSDWQATNRETKDDKEDISRNLYTTPPYSMGHGSRFPIHDQRYSPPGEHTAYCKCWKCEERKKKEKDDAVQKALELEKEAPGGASTETPFAQAKRLWEEADKMWKMTPPRCGKKKWKRLLKNFQEAERKLKMDQIRGQMKEFNQNVQMGLVQAH